MKIERVTDSWIETDSDGTIWISPIESKKYYLIGKTHDKSIDLGTIDKCFEKNGLTKGKYHYYYTKGGEDTKKLLDTDKVFSKVYSKGLENQKSFFKPKQGAFMTYYPQLKNYKYKFSIIMAIYNVESFIEEAILSVLNQTEKSVQLILVNDGTNDSSGKIAKEYANEYKNIIYLEQKNRGVSSARNLGMSFAEGEFWNFMDPDDTISENTLEKVYAFFKPRKHITDVVAIPIYFFGDKTGSHPLNGKFNKGNRIINLLSAGQSDIDLSMSASFIKMEAIEHLKLDTGLKISEDLLLLNSILLNNLTLGVVYDVRYNYRRINNFGAISKTQSEMDFYDTQQRFLVYERIIKNSLEKYGSVVKFIQQVVLYDLSWQFKSEQFINEKMLTNDEQNLLRDKYVFGLIGKYLDSQLIFESKRISYYVKQALIHEKFQVLNIPVVKNRFGVWQSGYKIAAIEDVNPLLVSVTEEKNNISIVFQLNYSNLFLEYYPDFKILLDINGEKIKPKISENNDMNVFRVLNKNITHSRFLKFEIPVVQSKFFNKPIKVILRSDDIITQIKTRFTKHEFSSLSNEIDVDSISDNYVAKIVNGDLQIAPKNLPEIIRLLDEAFGQNSIAKQEFLERRRKKQKPVWLFEDRPNKAEDNAESMFKYVVNNHPEIDAYFILDSNSNDWERLSSIGNTIAKYSVEHMNIWSIADVIISAHAEYQIFNPVARGLDENTHEYYKTLRILNKPKFVFLQHGISRSTHHLNRWLNLTNKNIKLFIVSTIYELNEFSSIDYHYEDSIVRHLGMPRLDDLLQTEITPKNKIIFMPTWRKSLVDLSDEQFVRTEYFKEINNFLNDKKLQKGLKKYNYNVAFKIHPNLEKFSHLFNLPKNVYVSTESYGVLYKESKIALTDFSSAVIDFAYTKRPVIQYWFDENSYFKGHTFNKNVEENEEAIYGNVYSNDEYEDFMKELITKMGNPIMDSKFKSKVDHDFILRDGKNHDRVFKAICEIMKQ